MNKLINTKLITGTKSANLLPSQLFDDLFYLLFDALEIIDEF